jgi:outer membrane assembly lipoprotein YfiO
MNRRTIALAALSLAAISGCIPFRHREKKTAAPPPLLQNTPKVVDSLWNLGEDLFRHGKWGKSNEVLTRVATVLPPGDHRLTRLRFYQGEIQYAEGNELQAVREFRRISDETPDDSLAPDALLRAADAYANLWKKPELDPTYGTTALGVYAEVTARYPGTLAAKRAEMRTQGLQDRFAYKEYKNALFYYRFKAYDSAILSLRNLIAQYPKAGIVPEALETLVLSYKALGYKEDIKETCEYIGRFFPNPEGPLRLCPPPATGAP